MLLTALSKCQAGGNCYLVPSELGIRLATTVAASLIELHCWRELRHSEKAPLVMAKKAQIKGVPEDYSTQLKKFVKSEYYDQDKFISNLVSFSSFSTNVVSTRKDLVHLLVDLCCKRKCSLVTSA